MKKSHIIKEGEYILYCFYELSDINKIIRFEKVKFDTLMDLSLYSRDHYALTFNPSEISKYHSTKDDLELFVKQHPEFNRLVKLIVFEEISNVK
jgi:hypothetical protein